MVDLHCHILPGLDDGAETLEDSLAMAEDAIRLVIKDCIAHGEPVPTPQIPRVQEITVTLAP